MNSGFEIFFLGNFNLHDLAVNFFLIHQDDLKIELFGKIKIFKYSCYSQFGEIYDIIRVDDVNATRQLIAAAVLDGEFCGGRREPPGVLVRSSRPPPISMTADGCVGHGYTRRDEVHGRIEYSMESHKCSSSSTRLLLLLAGCKCTIEN